MRKLFRITLLIALFSPCAAAQLATATVTPGSPGQAIPANFCGISTDFFDAIGANGGNFFITNTLFPQVLKNLIFTNQKCFMVLENDPGTAHATPTPTQIGFYNTLVTNVGGNLNFTLPFNMCASASPSASATAYVTAYIANAGAGWSGLTGGNEPDGACVGGSYGSPHSYTTFKNNFDAFVTAIHALSGGSALKFADPNFGGQQPFVYTAGNLNSFCTGEAANLSICTQHWYTQNGCSGSPTLAAELLPAAAHPTDFTLSGGIWNYAANAHTAGETFRISEMNDIDCSGVAGISNTFANALWLPDAMFNLAHAGVDGVNIFNDQGQYDLFDFPSTAGCTINVTTNCRLNPNYYGYVLFQEATQNSAKFIPCTLTTTHNTTCWATIDAASVVRIVINNKDQSASGAVSITLPGYGVGTLKVLACASVTCTSGVTYNGQTFDGSTTGLITGTPTNTQITPASNVYSFSLTTTQAALLVVNPVASTPPLSLVPGWHSIPNSAPCGGGAEHNPTYMDPDNFPLNLPGSTQNYAFQFVENCNYFIGDSNSGVYDTLRHRLLLYGGGHQHAWGNFVMSVEMGNGAPHMVFLNHSANPNSCPVTGTASTTISGPNGSICQYNSTGGISNAIAFDKCNWNGTFGAACVPTTQTPASVHTYNGLAYLPVQDQMIELGGAFAPQGNASQNAWLLNAGSVLESCAPKNGQPGCNPVWTPLGTPATNNYFNNPLGVGVIAAYDPNSQGLWVVNQTGLNFYTPTTQTIVHKTSTGIGYHSNGVVDPLDQYLIVIGPCPAGTAGNGPGGCTTQSTGNGILYYSIATGSTLTQNYPVTSGCTTITTPMATPGVLPAAQYQGMAWDPLTKQIVIYPNGSNVIWTLDPKTWICTSETYGSVQGTDFPQNTVTLSSSDQGTFGHFQYDPGLDVFVLCNDWANDCWYLRRRRAPSMIR